MPDAQQTGDYPAATAGVAEAIELFRDLGSRHDLAMALNSLGELSLRTSATQEARSRRLDYLRRLRPRLNGRAGCSLCT